ncbi:atherin-like [Pseudopipra pipra]|uniref:atherin-like n=1 Tax=Pseudopipra pipra TaxID=415032 RepID=UPI00313A2A9B
MQVDIGVEASLHWRQRTIVLVSRRSEPPEDSRSHRTVSSPTGIKLFPRGGVMLGTASRLPSPRLGQPDVLSPHTARCRAGSAVRRSPTALGGPGTRPGGRAGGGGGSAAPRPAGSRPPQPTHRGAHGGARGEQTDAAVSSSPPRGSPKVTLPSRAGSPWPPPPTAPPPLTWRLPGGSLTVSGGGARRSRGCLCRHLHSPLPR